MCGPCMDPGTFFWEPDARVEERVPAPGPAAPELAPSRGEETAAAEPDVPVTVRAGPSPEDELPEVGIMRAPPTRDPNCILCVMHYMMVRHRATHSGHTQRAGLVRLRAIKNVISFEWVGIR